MFHCSHPSSPRPGALCAFSDSDGVGKTVEISRGQQIRNPGFNQLDATQTLQRTVVTSEPLTQASLPYEQLVIWTWPLPLVLATSSGLSRNRQSSHAPWESGTPSLHVLITWDFSETRIMQKKEVKACLPAPSFFPFLTSPHSQWIFLKKEWDF